MSASRTGAAQRFRYRQKRRWESRFQIRTAAAPQQPEAEDQLGEGEGQVGGVTGLRLRRSGGGWGCVGRFEPEGRGRGQTQRQRGWGEG